MFQNSTISTTPIFVSAGNVNEMRVINDGPQIVSYSNRDSRLEADSLGLIASGATETLPAGLWFKTGLETAQIRTEPVALDTVSSIEARQSTTEKGQPNGYAGLDANGVVINTQLPPGLSERPVVRDYTIPGPIEVGAGVLGMMMPTDYESLQVGLSATSAPVGAPVIVDMNRDGTTMFTTQANRPQVDIGSFTSAMATPNTSSGLAGDRLTFDLDQVDEAIEDTAATFVSVETSVPGAGTTTYDVPRPAAAQSGDLTLLALWSQNTTDAFWTPPAGWTSAGSSFSFNGSRNHWFWRIHTGAAGPWTFTAGSSHTLSAVQQLTWRGVHQTTPIDSYVVGGVNTGTFTITVPEITTVNANVLELLHVQNSNSSVITGLGGSYTTHYGYASSAGRHAASLAHAAAGAKATFNLTLGTSSPHQVTRIGIRPVVAPAFEQIAGLGIAVRYLEITA